MNGSSGRGARFATQPRELSLQWTAVILADSVSRFGGGREPPANDPDGDRRQASGLAPANGCCAAPASTSSSSCWATTPAAEALPELLRLPVRTSTWSSCRKATTRMGWCAAWAKSELLAARRPQPVRPRPASDARVPRRAGLPGHGRRGAASSPLRRPRYGRRPVVRFAEKPALSEDWHAAHVYLVEPDALAGAADLSWEAGPGPPGPRTASRGLTSTTATGRRWKPCETSKKRTNNGNRATRPGRPGGRQQMRGFGYGTQRIHRYGVDAVAAGTPATRSSAWTTTCSRAAVPARRLRPCPPSTKTCGTSRRATWRASTRSFTWQRCPTTLWATWTRS